MSVGSFPLSDLELEPTVQRFLSALELQSESLLRQVSVLEEQARQSERSARSSWRFSLVSSVISVLSLVVAILAIVFS